jgi:AraC family transcriptional regulator
MGHGTAEISAGSGRVSRPASLQFASGQFYGGARLAYASHGIIVTHRVADRQPDEVLTHTHEDAHFVLISGGDYVSIAEGRPAERFPVLVYNPPGTTHRDHFEHGRGSYFAISLEPAKAKTAGDEIALPDGPIYLREMAQFALAMRVTRCCALQSGGLTLDALCHELLGSIDRHAQPVDQRPPSWLDKAVEFLHDRYLENLTVAKVADGVGIHPVHLARSFRHHFGCSPGEFTRFCRLQRAAVLLTRSERPLSEIALESGFGDQSQFSRAFARDLGISPREYRRAAGIQGFRAGMFQNDKRCSSRINKLREWDRAARKVARSNR